jgi:hypothetical protein
MKIKLVTIFFSVSSLVFVFVIHAIVQGRVARFFFVRTYQMAKNIPNGHKLYQMAIIYSKWSLNITTFNIPRPSKIYPKLDFWFENKPSGNPDARYMNVGM